ncbi:MAG: hypothetical protein CMJ18_12000 [Phycisphaeraceae bacterium]|nr:hypothetical protein [Phycisphaeraceae bacterium]
MRLSWQPAERNGYVVIDCDHPSARVRVWYVELYMRPGSRTNYPGGVIPHTTRLVEAADDGSRLDLRCELEDGVVVVHRVTVGNDYVDFRSEAVNPTDRASDVAWGAPCVIVDDFTGRDRHDYLDKCFIFLNGSLTRLPMTPWATEAVETPGQVWCPSHVDPADVESHPLSELVPSHGLIGCFSKDEQHLLAIAWQPYQDLFQGIIACLHADFRIDGLQPGERKKTRGRIYVMPADVSELVARYRVDFPEHGDP